MSEAAQPPLPRGGAEAQEPYEKRWLALGVVAMTVNIALPVVSADLGIDAASQ